MLRIRFATNDDTKSVRELINGILGEYGLSPDPAGVDSDLDNIEMSYMARGGYFEVITDRQQVVGTVGLYPLDESRIELRKMYLAPGLRRRGIGKWLLDRTLQQAWEMAYEEVVLETASVLTEAIGLYRSFGFEPVPGKADTDRCDQAYRLRLSGDDHLPSVPSQAIREI